MRVNRRLVLNLSIGLGLPVAAVVFRSWVNARQGSLGAILAITAIALGLARWHWSVSAPEERRLREISKSQQSAGLSVFQPRPLKRLVIYLIHAAIVVSCLLMVLGLLFPSLRPRLFPPGEGFRRSAHVFGAVLIVYLGAAAALFWTKDRGKNAKFIRLARLLQDTNERRIAPPTRASGSVASGEVTNAIARTLQELLYTIDQDWRVAKMLNPRRPARTAWVLLPHTATRRFRTVHLWPWDPVYRDVARNHRPVFYDSGQQQTLEAERARQESALRPEVYRSWFDDTYLPRLRACASLTGWAFLHPGPFVYDRVESCPAWDGSYLTLILDSERERYQFRSCAGIRLELAGTPFGALLLFDTAPLGFGEKDTATLKSYGALLSQLVAEAHAHGAYANEHQFYQS